MIGQLLTGNFSGLFSILFVINVELITDIPADLQKHSIHSMNMLRKGIIYILGRTELDDTGFHYATHNGTHFITFIWNFPFNICTTVAQVKTWKAKLWLGSISVLGSGYLFFLSILIQVDYIVTYKDTQIQIEIQILIW